MVFVIEVVVGEGGWHKISSFICFNYKILCGFNLALLKESAYLPPGICLFIAYGYLKVGHWNKMNVRKEQKHSILIRI